MKKNHSLLILTGVLIFLLTGCNKYSADKYIGEQITSLKEEDNEAFIPLLEEGIAASNESYALQFPEELKESYLDFLQTALQSVQFELDGAKKADDESYTVRVTYTPLDIGSTTESVCNKYLTSIKSSDLTQETETLLTKAENSIANSPVYQSESFVTLKVKKSGDSYTIADEDITDLLSRVLLNIMAPYNTICDVLDAQDYLTAVLNVMFKGDAAQYAKHTGISEETALSTLHESFLTPPSDLGSAYTTRCQAALNTICSQCQYSVGIPKKQSGLFNYIMDVTVTPNISVTNAMNELGNGTYYSQNEIDRTFVEILEKYAATPAYGEETTVTVTINYNTLSTAGNEDSELSELIGTILPVE